MIAITKELTDLLRKNRQLIGRRKKVPEPACGGWSSGCSKSNKYPPEGMEDAVQTVMSQCEM